MTRKRKSPTYFPGPDDYNYDELFTVMKTYRDMVVHYRATCGSQSPLRHEADILLAHIDAFAKLTPVHNALELINPQTHPTTKC